MQATCGQSEAQKQLSICLSLSQTTIKLTYATAYCLSISIFITGLYSQTNYLSYARAQVSLKPTIKKELNCSWIRQSRHPTMLSDSVSWWKYILTLQERGSALKQMTDMQIGSKVLMQGRLFSHGEISLLCSLELHPWNCKRTHANSCRRHYTKAEHPICDAIQQLLHAPATPCEVRDFTMHNSATVHQSWLCSQVHQTTPDRTQQRSWVWSVVRQT